MNKQEYEERLKALKDELIALNHKLDLLAPGSLAYGAASTRLQEIHKALAALDDEFNSQRRK